MSFSQLVRFIGMAEQYDTIVYSEYDSCTHTAYVDFANGESWTFRVES
jgi:hypothetical protein